MARDVSCAMSVKCTAPVTHIGDKGYVYCTAHAGQRRNSGAERCRKMSVAELARIFDGVPLRSYDQCQTCKGSGRSHDGNECPSCGMAGEESR